jgi:two-component system, OmpR family, sensor histidine kinase CpxA
LRKNGIFVKIYLWFWVTSALVLVAQVGLDRLTFTRLPRPFHLEQSLKPVLMLHSRTILHQYQAGDTTKMAEAREDLKSATGLDAYVVDQQGKEISARQLTGDVRKAFSTALSSGRLEVMMFRNGPILALPVKTPDGSSFVTVARLPRPEPSPLPPRSVFVDISRLLVGFFISACVCYGLARYMTKPVLKLSELTRRFAGGDLAARIGKDITRRQDEFSTLAGDFNRMAQRIESLMLQQRQLLGDISHELRSPLTRLNLALEIARKRPWEEAGLALERIETEAGLMEEMISQVLTLTRLEAGIDGVPLSFIDIDEVVEDIVDDADFEAQARGCAVRLVKAEAGYVRGNVDLLRRAIENVVRNAVRYAEPGTTIDIALRHLKGPTGAQIEIEVRDHGPGVPEEELANLFRPFYRVSASRDRLSGGAGLGLAITERSVAFHGGSVAARNGEDGGLVVSIRLPLSSDSSVS